MDPNPPAGSAAAAATLSRAIRSCGDSLYVDRETMALVRVPLAAVLLAVSAVLIVLHVLVAAGLFTGFHHHYGAAGFCFALLRLALVSAYQARIIYLRVRRARMQQQLPPPPPAMDMV